MQEQQNPNRTAATEPALSGTEMRLNRFLARAGIASRRKSDVLIQSGAVEVNGEIAADPWRSIVVGRDRVEVRGSRVALPDAFEYVVMHKPAGCLVTHRDTHDRPTVFAQLEGLHPGTVAVGRLDRDTTGLLLLTDDGELAFRLTHPRFGVDKRYEVVVRGEPGSAALTRLRHGIELGDGRTAPARVQVQGGRTSAQGTEMQLTVSIHEGRKRPIRRMFKAVGHPVLALKRVALDGLELDLPRAGQWRHLTAAEVRKLRAQVGLCD